METAEGAGGAGHPPKHSIEAAIATTESDTHPRREYGKEASEALVRGQASAGPALAEDGHGTTRHGKRTQREEGGDENPRRASSERSTTDGETEEIPPPERSHAPNASGRKGGEGRGGTPTQQRAPMARSEGSGGDPQEHRRENPQRGEHQDTEGGSKQALRAREPDGGQTEGLRLRRTAMGP